MSHARRFACATAIAVTASFSLAAQQPAGPPAFVTFPILTHVTDNGLDHGHFVEGPGESAVPAPVFKAPAPGTAAAATFAGSATASRETDVSLSTGSYEGETGAVSNGTYLVGGSNHIYPGACSAAALPGATGDCAPQ